MTDWTGPAEPLDRALLSLTGESVGHPGAKGAVHVVDESTYYKEYLEPIDDPGHLDELIGWRRSLPPEDRAFLDAHCAWPLRRVADEGLTTGFLMAPAPDEFWADMLGERHTMELQHLIHAARAKQLGITVPDRPQRLLLAQDLAELLALFDRHDMVYGDISEKNVLWTLRGEPRTYFIDCDNARRVHSAHRQSAMARNDGWRDPLLGPDDLPDVDSDRFALAVFFYRVFYGVTVSVDQQDGKVLLPDDAPELPRLEALLGAGLGLIRPRPTADEWAGALRNADSDRPVPPPPKTAPPRVREGRKKTFAAVAIGVVAASALAVPLIVRGTSHAEHRAEPQPDVATTTATPAAPPAPELLTRDEALTEWAAGPVGIQINRYYSWYVWDENKADAFSLVYLRPSITNDTPASLDLSLAYDNLVLVTDTKPKPIGSDVPVYELPGMSEGNELYGLGSAYDWTFPYDGTDHKISWSAQTLAPGATFTSKRVQGGSMGYQFPPVATKADDSFSLAPAKLHVLGVGWFENEQMMGFAPVSAWKNPNTPESFLTE
ncbi:hypothetical protein Aab01nite_49470 [Paractinoplanes abujensis]|uniref:Protein kinase domain-containing protein n=1 Tax=Paractinoplanes abujensis TaxID=882441 RepID=A0A7W7G4M2_9ACTN|nr:hypothetical protein [Actinoplanes abujensis]MBB4693986.1 hypothetical protein [Actinoplanes abujensis]GID21357.1 hypothetical protein Aab01nite_49470 [Actinoplanes abujensis]